MAICVPQPFDSEIVGGPVYRLNLDSDADLPHIARIIPADAILVSLRIPASWPAPDRSTGFREIETLVQLERPLLAEDARSAVPGIRVSTPADAGACAAIARSAFFADRYHSDPMIADQIAERIKAAWGRNEVSGRSDRTFVRQLDGEVVGFNGCLLEGRRMIVDLIAVSEQHQGKGIGAALLKAAFAHYASRADHTLIATQADNTGALTLYLKLGYRETGRVRTYHFTPDPISIEQRVTGS